MTGINYRIIILLIDNNEFIVSHGNERCYELRYYINILKALGDDQI